MKKELIRAILKGIDKALPSDIWTSKSRVLRTRLMVSTFYLDLLLWVPVLAVKIFAPSSYRMYSNLTMLLYVAFDLICLYLIKRSFNIGKIIGAYILSNLVPFGYNLLTQKVYASAGVFIWIPGYTLTLLLLSDWKTRIIFLAMILGLTLSFPSLSIPVRFSDPANIMAFIVSMATLLASGNIWIYLKSRSIMQDDLDHEIEWQLRNVKLAEISTIARIIHSLISLPLKEFSDKLSGLTRHAALTNNEIFLEEMQRELDELVRISQSYAWVYRAFQKEGGYSASSDVLVMNLQMLSKLSFDKGRWEWRGKPKAAPIEISGAIPSLMLLLFCIITQIVENPPFQGPNFIQLEVNQTDGRVNWIFTWPAKDEGQKSILDGTSDDAWSLSAMRRELIEDLQKACDAKLSEYQRGSSHVLKVSGAWSHEVEG